MATFDCLAFDADDTLWHSEDGFRATEVAFCELLAPYVSDGVDIKAALTATERANLHTYGYGVKAFGLSMIEAAITISQGKVPTEVMVQLLQNVRDLRLAFGIKSEAIRFLVGRRTHRSISPKTISREPMTATASASICPFESTSIACKCA